MITPKDINAYRHLPKDKKNRAEKSMQQDDLNYMASQAFEQFQVNDDEIELLQQKITKKIPGSSHTFNTVFISLMCGLLIGVSVFFVLFQKSKIHPSVFQNTETERFVNTQLNNLITETDTLFPVIPAPKPIKETEHYSSIQDVVQQQTTAELPDMLPTKAGSLPEDDNEEDLILQFSPNAPVVFIHNLKITNYRIYYFKQNNSIDLTVNSGISAQYESAGNIEKEYVIRSDNYLAHKIIKKAMWFFNKKNYTNCIEELNMLYEFNKTDANCQFYLGMCYYLTGKYAYANSFFEKNLDNQNNVFHQESEFYKALCLLETKQTEEAVSLLQTIVANKGFYSARAQEVLAKQNK